MHTVRLKISGFRGVRSADIALGRHAVRVGPNNSGKTIIIEALALLFGATVPCAVLVTGTVLRSWPSIGFPILPPLVLRRKVMHYGRYDQSIRTLAAP